MILLANVSVVSNTLEDEHLLKNEINKAKNRVESGWKWTYGPEGSFCQHLPWALARMLEGSSSLNGPYVSAFCHLTMVSRTVTRMNRLTDLVKKMP